MLELMNRHHRTLLIVITALTIVAFVLLYNLPQLTQGAGQAFVIDGRPVRQEQIQAMAQEIRFGYRGQGRLSDEELHRMVLQNLVFLSEAAKLGVTVTDDEVWTVIVQNPEFQTEGRFDMQKYNEFCQNVLIANQVHDRTLFNLLKYDITANKVQGLVSSTFHLSPLEIEQSWKGYRGRSQVEYLTFNLADFRRQVPPPSENEIKAAFAQNSSAFMAPEKRRVQYVRFAMPPASAVKVTDEEITRLYQENKASLVSPDGKPIAEAVARKLIRENLTNNRRLSAVRDEATAFAMKFVADPGQKLPDFDATAKEAKLTVNQTGLFAANTPLPGFDGLALNRAAFSLTQENPVSDPVVAGDAVLVLHLAEVEPTRPLTFEEARPEIAEMLVRRESVRLMQQAASNAEEKLRAGLAQGQSFASVAASLKLRPQELPPLAPADLATRMGTQFSDLEREIRQKTFGMPAGYLTPFEADDKGGFIAHVKAVTLPADASLQNDIPHFAAGLRANRQNQLFNAWVDYIMAKSGISFQD